LTVNYGGVIGGTSIVANGNTGHNSGRGIYATGYAYGIQANQTMVGNWTNNPDAAGVHGTGEIGVYGSGGIAGFSGPSAFFTSLLGNSRVSARNHTSTVQVRGTGSTLSSTALLVENSLGTPTMVVDNGGSVIIGTSTTNNSRLLIGGTVSGATLSTTRATHINATLLATGNTTTLIGLDIQPTFTPGSFTGLTQLALRVSGGTQIIGSGSTGTTLSVFSVDGSSGRLFDVSDDLSSTLFSVNTIAGLPVIEAFANSSVVLGKYGQNTLVVSGTSVGIGTNATNGKLIVKGSGTTSGSTTVLIQNSATTTTLIINDAGNIGIGTSSPQAKLDVSGTSIFRTGVTMNSSLTLGNVDITSSWSAYTPTWTTDGGTQPALNNGTLTGFFKLIGKICFVRVKLNPGSTTTFGSGAFQFSLPFSASSPDGIQFPCSILNNGFAWYQATVNGTYSGDVNKSAIIALSSGGVNSSEAVTATHPITFGVSDSLQFNGSYEIA
jgi:hypothetical protein